MEGQERLSLNYFLQLCLQFEDNPSAENDQAIKHFLGAIQVREYLPLKEKTIISVNIAKDLIDELDATGAASTLEIGKIFKGLMAYVVNMDMDIAPLDKTFVAYDYCYQYNLVDTIMNGCEKDFNRLCSYIDGMVNTSNAYRLIQTASMFNNAEYDKWINTMNDLKQQLTPEILKDLLAIDVMNNGGSELQQVLGEAAVEEVNKGLTEDERKYDAIGKDLNTHFGTFSPIITEKDQEADESEAEALEKEMAESEEEEK